MTGSVLLFVVVCVVGVLAVLFFVLREPRKARRVTRRNLVSTRVAQGIREQIIETSVADSSPPLNESPPEPDSAPPLPVEAPEPSWLKFAVKDEKPWLPKPIPPGMVGAGIDPNAYLTAHWGRLPPVTIDTTPPVCPNCGIALAKRPARKSACPHCGDTIYVKYRPSDTVKRLVAESALPEIEAEWAEYQSAKAKLVSAAERVAWGLSAQATEEEAMVEAAEIANSDLEDIGRRIQAAAYLLSRETGVKKKRWGIFNQQLRLEQFLRNRILVVELRGGVDPCPTCSALVGRTFSTAEAKANHPVPNEKCIRWPIHRDCCAFWAMPRDYEFPSR